MHALKNLEHKAQIDAELLGFERQISIETGPANVVGIEINEFAAELARATVWIGDLQWCRENGRPIAHNPILKPLDGIEHRDALLTFDPPPGLPPEMGEETSAPTAKVSTQMKAETSAAIASAMPHADAAKLLPPQMVKGNHLEADKAANAASAKLLPSQMGEGNHLETDKAAIAAGAKLLPPRRGKAGMGVEATATVLEADWPECDVIIGNPPFLGGSKKRGELGDDYFDALAKTFDKNRVPAGADLVCYWFDKARAQIAAGKAKAAGLVATNSIRGGANRTVLDAICRDSRIFEAWSDEEWINDGAAVRVSLVCFGEGAEARLNGQPVTTIHADLIAGDSTSVCDLTQVMKIKQNEMTAFEGMRKDAPFDVDGELARKWLNEPNPNNKQTADVLKPSWNGIDVTRRPRDGWVIDFGSLAVTDAALFENPFEYVQTVVRPIREKNNDKQRREKWWLFGRSNEDLRSATKGFDRFIVTPRVTKHRVFRWIDGRVSADTALVAIARADDTTFGILHSRFHELWSLRLGTSLEDRPRYTPTTCFETFPFPAGLTPKDTAHGAPDTPAAQAIAAAAVTLNQMRDNWLNPPEWVDWVITPEEEKAGFPKRPVAKPGFDADLKKRTLTNLYNTRPAWLTNLHVALDKAVAAAYGWNDYTPDMPDDEILRRLLTLNLARAG